MSTVRPLDSNRVYTDYNNDGKLGGSGSFNESREIASIRPSTTTATTATDTFISREFDPRIGAGSQAQQSGETETKGTQGLLNTRRGDLSGDVLRVAALAITNFANDIRETAKKIETLNGNFKSLSGQDSQSAKDAKDSIKTEMQLLFADLQISMNGLQQTSQYATGTFRGDHQGNMAPARNIGA